MRTFILSLILTAILAPTVPAQGTPKKRIAIFDFDNAGVQGAAVPMFMQSGALPNVGKGAANLLVSRIVKDGHVTVIERSELEKLLSEQNLGNSDRTDPLTAAKLGRLLGVDAILLGSVAHYDFEDKMTSGGGSRFGGFGGYSTSTKHNLRSFVKLVARLVSPDTAEVVAVSEGLGEVIKKDVKVDMRDTSSILTGGTAGQPLMNDAMEKAITQLSAQLHQAFPKLPARVRAVDGLVADANESGRLVLNVGGNHGVKVGDTLQVWRAGKEIRDPATGKVLLRDDTLLGDAVVTTVNDISSVATYRGTQAVKSGDIVKTPPRQP